MQAIDLQPPKEAAWIPTHYTPTEGQYSKGVAVEAFAAAFLQAIDGLKPGEKIILTEWQKWLLKRVMETDDKGMLVLREVLIMLPRKNGKTFLIAIIMLYMLCFAPDYAQMFSAAKDLKQAQNVFRMIKAWIEYSPELKKMFKIRETDSTITNIYTGSFYRAIPADGQSMHGTNPYFVIIDELHGMVSRKHRDFIESLTTGSGAQLESIIVYISTAGATVHNTLLGEMYTMMKEKIAAGEDVTGQGLGFFCWEAEPEDDITDRKVWEKANPMLAEGLLKYSFLETMLEKYKNNPAPFMRYFLNIWVSVAGDPFIHPQIWDAIGDETAVIPAGASIVAGFDGAYVKGDSAVIVIQDIRTGVFKIWDIWERPVDADPDYYISRREIEDSFVRLSKEYDLKLIYADKFYYENDLREWAYTYDWNTVFIHQGGQRMRELASNFQKDIDELLITHTNQEELNRHIANTFADEIKGFAKEDKYSLNKIDATVASILCNGAREHMMNIDDTPTMVLRWD